MRTASTHMIRPAPLEFKSTAAAAAAAKPTVTTPATATAAAAKQTVTTPATATAAAAKHTVTTPATAAAAAAAKPTVATRATATAAPATVRAATPVSAAAVATVRAATPATATAATATVRAATPASAAPATVVRTTASTPPVAHAKTTHDTHKSIGARTPTALAFEPAPEVVQLFQDTLLNEFSRAAAVTARQPSKSSSAATYDERVAAAIYTLLAPNERATITRARTAFHSTHAAPPNYNSLLANTRDLLQIDDADVENIHKAVAGLLHFNVGITPAGELAAGVVNAKALHRRMLETRALLNEDYPIEFSDNQFLIECVVGAIQASCAAYVHARTPARAQLDVVTTLLSSQIASVIDWDAKITDAIQSRRVALMSDNIIVTL